MLDKVKVGASKPESRRLQSFQVSPQHILDQLGDCFGCTRMYVSEDAT